MKSIYTKELNQILEKVKNEKEKEYSDYETVEVYMKIGNIIKAAESYGENIDNLIELIGNQANKNGYSLYLDFSEDNLRKMFEVYETYSGTGRTSSFVYNISWAKHLIIIGECKSKTERIFYSTKTAENSWNTPQLFKAIHLHLCEKSMAFLQIDYSKL